MPNLLGGGAERIVLTLLRNMGVEFQPTLLLLRNEIAYPGEIPDNVRVIFISQKGERIRHNLFRFRQVLRELKGQCDIIIGGLELDATYYAYAIGQLIRKPVIGWIQTPLMDFLSGYSVWHKNITRWIYPRLTHIVYSSQHIEEAARPYRGSKPWPGSVIHNPIDIDWISKKSLEPLPEWFTSLHRKPYFIALGRLVPEKGFDILLQGFAMAVARGLDYHLLILGEGNQRKTLEQLAIVLGISHRLFLPGFIPNPYPLIKQATALASSSLYEGVGMTLYEGMALGVPVVANISISSSKAILGNGKYGYQVEVNTPEVWAIALEKAIHRDSRMIEACLQKTASFTPSRSINDWRTVINQCIR